MIRRPPRFTRNYPLFPCPTLFRSGWSSVRCLAGSDLVDGRGLEAAGDVDAEFFGSTEGVVIGVAEVDRGAVGREDLDVQAERLHLLHEHLERLGDAGLLDVLALDRKSVV